MQDGRPVTGTMDRLGAVNGCVQDVKGQPRVVTVRQPLYRGILCQSRESDRNEPYTYVIRMGMRCPQNVVTCVHVVCTDTQGSRMSSKFPPEHSSVGKLKPHLLVVRPVDFSHSIRSGTLTAWSSQIHYLEGHICISFLRISHSQARCIAG